MRSAGGEATSCAVPTGIPRPRRLTAVSIEQDGGQAVSALLELHAHVLRSARPRFNPLTLADADADPEHVPRDQ